mmetsp:Transcript_49877/g.133510  ORF Transcript_49877/g.133510 Transcript_49877/m.133510 type:complete len:214 (+) Transcript_49877:1334-1975(+)
MARAGGRRRAQVHGQGGHGKSIALDRRSGCGGLGRSRSWLQGGRSYLFARVRGHGQQNLLSVPRRPRGRCNIGGVDAHTLTAAGLRVPVEQLDAHERRDALRARPGAVDLGDDEHQDHVWRHGGALQPGRLQRVRARGGRRREQELCLRLVGDDWRVLDGDAAAHVSGPRAAAGGARPRGLQRGHRPHLQPPLRPRDPAAGLGHAALDLHRAG